MGSDRLDLRVDSPWAQDKDLTKNGRNLAILSKEFDTKVGFYESIYFLTLPAPIT